MKPMEPAQLESSLEGIRHLLSHLHTEVAALEDRYTQVLGVLRKLEGAAETDELTGLRRRRPFFDKWQALLDECQKLNENCGVLLVDVDHFKRLNDTHGHQTGDEVLSRIAELLRKFESPNVFSGRYGGEEFAVAIRGSDAEILGVAEMIRRSAERLHGPVMDRDGKPSLQVEWKCTLSVGMASSKREGYDAPRLLKAADEALYCAKRAGRNRVQAAG